MSTAHVLQAYQRAGQADAFAPTVDVLRQAKADDASNIRSLVFGMLDRMGHAPVQPAAAPGGAAAPSPSPAAPVPAVTTAPIVAIDPPAESSEALLKFLETEHLASIDALKEAIDNDILDRSSVVKGVWPPEACTTAGQKLKALAFKKWLDQLLS